VSDQSLQLDFKNIPTFLINTCFFIWRAQTVVQANQHTDLDFQM